MARLTHLDAKGRARMVDVGDKAPSVRAAVASGRLRIKRKVLDLIRDGAIPKGDVLAVARIAGIMAAKRASEIIPLCHPLVLDYVAVEVAASLDGVEIRAVTKTTGRTGVEMEALAAVSAAALTVYDMCKVLDRGIVIERIQLEEKSGGRSGRYVRG